MTFEFKPLTCDSCSLPFINVKAYTTPTGIYHKECKMSPRATPKREALAKLQERMDILYNGNCPQANDLMHELTFTSSISTKFITLISEALWQLR